jgi:hypothetical protein
MLMPANDDAIKDYVDRSGFKSDTAFVLEQLNLVQEQYTKLASFKLTLNKDNSFPQAVETQAKLAKTTSDLTAKTKELFDIEQKLAALRKQSVNTPPVSGAKPVLLDPLDRPISRLRHPPKHWRMQQIRSPRQTPPPDRNITT